MLASTRLHEAEKAAGFFAMDNKVATRVYRKTKGWQPEDSEWNLPASVTSVQVLQQKQMQRLQNLPEIDTMTNAQRISGWPGRDDRVVVYEEGEPVGWIEVEAFGCTNARDVFLLFLKPFE